MEARLQRVLDSHRLSCGAIISENGDVVARAGDFAAISNDGLVSALLGTLGSAKATYDMAQSPERIKPVIWAQGDDFAILDCASELLVLVFGKGRGDVKAEYELSRSVARSIADEFASG